MATTTTTTTSGRGPAADTSGLGHLSGFTNYINAVTAPNLKTYDDLNVAAGIMYKLVKASGTRFASIDTLNTARQVRKAMVAAAGHYLEANAALRSAQGIIVVKFGAVTSGTSKNPAFFDPTK